MAAAIEHPEGRVHNAIQKKLRRFYFYFPFAFYLFQSRRVADDSADYVLQINS
jgi:hypothetical protein